MSDQSVSIKRIREAIDVFDYEQARILLREALKNPTPEIYYLSYLVAIDDAQRITLLSRALELDPTYPPVVDAMRKIQAQGKKYKVEATPVVEIGDVGLLDHPMPMMGKSTPVVEGNDQGHPAPITPVVHQPTQLQDNQALPQNITVSPPVNKGGQNSNLGTQDQTGVSISAGALRTDNIIEKYRSYLSLFLQY
jgi:hypothetical protein